MIKFFVVAITFMALVKNSHAYTLGKCIDQAKTNNEVTLCGNKVVPPLERRVDNEFNRLSNKFRDNRDMQELIRITKSGWSNYRNLQCNLEGAVSAGGQTKGTLPLEANKAYLRCVIRFFQDIEPVLGELDDASVHGAPVKLHIK